MHMRTPRVHSHLVAFDKQSLSIGCFSGRPLSKDQSCLRKVASDNWSKILGLLLKRPNIALVTEHPFRIDPQNSNDGATYSLIVG